MKNNEYMLYFVNEDQTKRQKIILFLIIIFHNGLP